MDPKDVPVFRISQEPTHPGASYVLVEPAPGRLVLRPPLADRLYGAALLALGAWRAPHVRFDRATGAVAGTRLPRPRGEGHLFARLAAEEIPLSAIAAVQLCSAEIDDGRERLGVVQVNLVLAEPPGQRYAVLATTAGAQARHDAADLAGFLDVPLLDPTTAASDAGNAN